MSQAIYVSFCEAFVDSYQQFDERFKESLVAIVHEWLTGLVYYSWPSKLIVRFIELFIIFLKIYAHSKKMCVAVAERSKALTSFFCKSPGSFEPSHTAH